MKKITITKDCIDLEEYDENNIEDIAEFMTILQKSFTISVQTFIELHIKDGNEEAFAYTILDKIKKDIFKSITTKTNDSKN